MPPYRLRYIEQKFLYEYYDLLSSHINCYKLHLISSKITGLPSKTFLKKVKQAHKLLEFPNIFNFLILTSYFDLLNLPILNIFHWLFYLSGNFNLTNLEL